MKPLLAIVGPTASGKTDISLRLAKKYKGEIINADSRAIYKDFIIGTASPILDYKSKIINPKTGSYLINGIVHHLLHFINPKKIFTVAEFQKIAYKTIDDIIARNKIPFLVGGTGLYIDAVTKGYVIPEVAPDFVLRDKLEKEPTKKLYQRLQKLDPFAAKNILSSNKRRIIRALEVCLITKKPFSKQQEVRKPPYDILTIGISWPREELYKRIKVRVEKQIKMGLVDEVKKLVKKKYPLSLPAMTGLGYKQIAEHIILKNPETLKEAVEQIKCDTRRFSRRQMSWFKRDKSIKWMKNKAEAERLVEKFLYHN